MRTNWQVCSPVVQAKSQNIAAIGTQLNTLPGCEVALSDVESGQLIVVAEADQSETLMQTLSQYAMSRAYWRCRWFITSRMSKVRKHHETQSS